MTLQDLFGTLAENLRLYRKLHGFTQTQLAECLGYSDKSVSKWERGEAVPDIGILFTLSEIYGVTVSELIGQTPKSKETREKLRAMENDRRKLEHAKKRALERAKKQKKKQ